MPNCWPRHDPIDQTDGWKSSEERRADLICSSSGMTSFFFTASPSQGALIATISYSETADPAFSTSRLCNWGSFRRSKFLRDAMLLRKSAHMLRIDKK